MIEVILWDVDGTLLDFLAAEKAAMEECFAHFGLGELTPDRLARYSALNRTYWQRLERGEITKPQVLVGRFREFFTNEGISPDLAEPFNARYQEKLGDTVCFQDGADKLVARLKGRVRQYAATNGTRVAQEKKLRKSDLDKLLDGVFISELLGAEKPSQAFFDQVLAAIGPVDRRRVLMVGDSLTSDMAGGLAAGLRCCWYNPQKLPAPENMALDYIISDLNQVENLLNLPPLPPLS